VLSFALESDHVGILVLGNKLSEEPFHEDDKELLFTLVNNLTVALKNALSKDLSNFYLRAAALKVALDSLAYKGPIIAYSPKMRKIKEDIAVLSKKSEPILMSGAAGTGKVFIAAKIHEAGPDSGRPFIVIDCRNLAEGERANSSSALPASSKAGSIPRPLNLCAMWAPSTWPTRELWFSGTSALSRQPFRKTLPGT